MHIYASEGASLKMQVLVKTIVYAMFAILLSMVAFPTSVVFAQDSEGEDNTSVVGSIFEGGEEETEQQQQGGVGEVQTYRDVSRAEVIDNQGNIQNPGGAGNQDITLSDNDVMTRPTNLAQMVIPQSIQRQDYADMKISLQAVGYAISDMQPTQDMQTGRPLVIVRGIDGVMQQPNQMDLDSVSAQYGYAVQSHLVIGGAWQTTFESVTGYQPQQSQVPQQ